MHAHQSALIRYAQSLLGDAEPAKDVVQETFIKLCQQSPDKVKDHLIPWLFRVARNQCLNVLRKEKRMSHLESPETFVNEDNPVHTQTRDRQKQETITSLFELVDTLPDRQRELVRLKFQQDFSYQEIAEVTGLTVTNVGYILHQAVRSLKQEWEALEQSPVGGN